MPAVNSSPPPRFLSRYQCIPKHFHGATELQAVQRLERSNQRSVGAALHCEAFANWLLDSSQFFQVVVPVPVVLELVLQYLSDCDVHMTRVYHSLPHT